MAMYFYYVNFGVSLLFAVVYAFIFHKRFDVNLLIISVLVPVINLGFVMLGMAKELNEAFAALRLTYIGGSFLILAAMFLIFNICGIKINPFFRAGTIALSCCVYATTLTIGHIDLFYASPLPKIGTFAGASYLYDKHYGPMHTVFYALVIVYYLITIGAIVYTFFRKKQVSKTILVLIIISVSIAIGGFFCGRYITDKLEILPVTYNLAMIVYCIIASRVRLYDVSDSVLDTMAQKGETGFVSFDHRFRYLGSNETAKKVFPELLEFRVDHRVLDNEFAKAYIIPMVEDFKSDHNKNSRHIDRDGKVYLVSIEQLIIGKLNRGFQFVITDDTAREQLIRLMKNYSEELEQEVSEKTAHIVQMQNKLVLGMATMIEGRDNSTGGHIKRTSEGVRILVDEMRKAGYPGLEEGFCKRLIAAAPMHDLGKITVDDAVLRKPGRFTPEEFNEMKKHAPEGARIVAEILQGTDDEEFARIAENVAHYHHERYDGSGYPCGLVGENIPFEARIMAIADVYDALVSKRVYKEKMSFEEADRIILAGMGTQFDPKLKPYYLAAKPRLEAYYESLD